MPDRKGDKPQKEEEQMNPLKYHHKAVAAAQEAQAKAFEYARSYATKLQQEAAIKALAEKNNDQMSKKYKTEFNVYELSYINGKTTSIDALVQKLYKPGRHLATWRKPDLKNLKPEAVWDATKLVWESHRAYHLVLCVLMDVTDPFGTHQKPAAAIYERIRRSKLFEKDPNATIRKINELFKAIPL
ncbi:MAG: hypothetical protein Q9222_002977 [Ikaeria aurantiellina]